MKNNIFLLVTFSLLAGICALAQPQHIAFNVALKDSAGKSNYEVFTMRSNGSEMKNITRDPDVAWTYVSQGKDLYFISDRDSCYRCYFLYKTDVNGTDVKKVSHLQLEDSWMDFRHDGKELVVSGRIGATSRQQLFLINAETGAYKQISFDTSAYFRDPVFSPDGSQLAVVYRPDKRNRSIKDEVYLMDIATGRLRRLTTYPPEKMQAMIPGYTAGALRWHPQENFITYISFQEGRHHIYFVSPDGKKQGRLTNHPFAEGWHDWSADGNWLVFDSSNADESQYDILLMNWKTKAVENLTKSAFKYQQCPVFIQ